MSLILNNIYHGFKLLSTEAVQEINSQAYMFEHEKSGARLLYLANDDENKVFSVSFRTPADDNTGVAHILEHSVLCGSRKYPLKEPFVELVKGSMNTFLNAMTFPDKTMYPIASMNDKDFHNLMDVYLDAVFYPRIYDNKYLLKQEGWHYSLDENNDLIYKGVVYNEMKGVYSSPEAILDQASQAALFPDTTYAFESGGDPDYIPELTQEKFEKFHSTYYHPANSYIYLYGKMDIIERLAFLDSEYLHAFERISIDSHIALQPYITKTTVKRVEYPLSEGEDTANRSFLSLAFVVGEPTDIEKYITLSILDSILVNMPGAPIKQALLDAQIAQDVESSMNGSIRQNVFSIIASGTDEAQQDKFISTVYAALNNLVREGIDKELLESALNMMEFKLREADFGNYPKGLIYNIRAMDTWLYDADPLTALRYNQVIESMREKIKGNFFESFIEGYLLDNTHRAVTVLVPKVGMEVAKSQAMHDKLQAIKDGFSAAELEKITNEMQTLQEMQMYIDPPEALEKIPLLSLEDIDKQAQLSAYQVQKQNGYELVYQPEFTNKIVYVEGHLDAAAVPQELIEYYYLYSDLLKQMSTKHYSYFELSKQVSLHTGGISFATRTWASNTDADVFAPKFSFNLKCLQHKLPQTIALTEEILKNTDFSDKKRLQETINEEKTGIESSLSARGHSIAANRVSAYSSKAGVFEEKGDLGYYYFISRLSNNFEAMADEIVEKLNQISAYLVRSNNMVVGYCCEEDDKAEVQAQIVAFADNLPQHAYPAAEYQLSMTNINEGIYTPGMIQYVAMGGNYKKLGFEYHGSLRVVETLLKYEYLWTNIRVKGGAYGAMVNTTRNGMLVFVSYRDPNLTNTVQVYKGLGEYLKGVELSEREILKYIIGTVSKLDTPLYSSAKLSKSVARHILSISDAEVQANRDQILQTSLSDINKAGELVGAVIDSNNICVVGSESKIKEAKELFNVIFAATTGA